MVRSFGDPEPEPPTPAPPAMLGQIPIQLVPHLDLGELDRLAGAIQRAVYLAVRAGFEQAAADMAADGELEDPGE